MSGTVRRRKKEDKYTTVSNETLRCKDLSWKAKGLLCYLLSHSENFEIRKKKIHEFATDGYDSTNAAFKELESKGYIKQTGNGRDSRGNFIGFDYEFDEVPSFLEEDKEECEEEPMGIIRDGLTATGEPRRETHDKEEQVSITVNSNTLQEEQVRIFEFFPEKKSEDSKELNSIVKNLFLTKYKKEFETDYYFGAKDSGKLRPIGQKIFSKIKEKNDVVTIENFKSGVSLFFEVAYSIRTNYFLQDFNLSNIDSKFNDIFARIKQKQEDQKNGTTEPKRYQSKSERIAADMEFFRNL